MKANIVLELMTKYATCPKCGSDKIGLGFGKLEVTEKELIRTCSCGFAIKVDETGKEWKIHTRPSGTHSAYSMED